MATKAELEKEIANQSDVIIKLTIEVEKLEALNIEIIDKSAGKYSALDSKCIRLKGENIKFGKKLEDIELIIKSYLEIHCEYLEIDPNIGIFQGSELIETQETKHLNVLLNLIRGK